MLLVAAWAGYPVEFFIEGTRSRSGKMIQPKMGLLSIITDPFFEEMLKPNRSTRNAGSPKKQTLEDVHFVPIGVAYEKVPFYSTFGCATAQGPIPLLTRPCMTLSGGGGEPARKGAHGRE